MLYIEENANSQASGIESFSETDCFSQLIILVPTIIEMVLLYSVVGTTKRRVEIALSEKDGLIIDPI